LEQGVKDQQEALLDLQVGVFDDAARGLTHETHGSGQGEFAPLGFGENPGGEAGPDGMEF
jgi:hypothetical protein